MRLGDFGVSTVLDIAKTGFEAWRDYERLDQADEALALKKKELAAELAALERAKADAEAAHAHVEDHEDEPSHSTASTPQPGGLLASLPVGFLVAGGLGFAALVLYLLSRGRRR